MRISVTGISNRGFTLLELLVVLVILAGIASLVFPRLSAFQNGENRTSARNLAAMLKYLDERAVASRTRYRLSVDLEQQKIQVQQLTADGEAREPEDPFLQRNPVSASVRLTSVMTERRGEISEGTVKIAYGPGGLSEAILIHLGAPGMQQYTIQALPVNGSVKVAEGHLESIK